MPGQQYVSQPEDVAQVGTVAILPADEPEALLVVETAGTVTDLSEALVEQHLLGVGRDEPEVSPADLQQHCSVPGLVTSCCAGGAITVILRLAGTDWKEKKC